MQELDLSIIVPAYNEESNLELLYLEITKVAVSLACRYEIIFVNDGSTDRSQSLLNKLWKMDQHVGIVELTKNIGHQAALLAGIRASRGRAVLSLDADFQHPPQVILQLWNSWLQSKADVVQTYRDHTHHGAEGVIKRSLSKLFYRISNSVFNASLVEGGADFRLIGPSMIKELKNDSRAEIFLRGFVAQKKFSCQLLPFKVATRKSGTSKYSLRKQLALAMLGFGEMLLQKKSKVLWIANHLWASPNVQQVNRTFVLANSKFQSPQGTIAEFERLAA